MFYKSQLSLWYALQSIFSKIQNESHPYITGRIIHKRLERQTQCDPDPFIFWHDNLEWKLFGLYYHQQHQ